MHLNYLNLNKMNFNSKNPHYKKDTLTKMSQNHFMHSVGIQMMDVQEGMVVAQLNVLDAHRQQSLVVHGGVTATIADIAMGFAAYTLVEPNQSTVTSDLSVHYLKPGKGSILEAVGKVIKAGQYLYYCECDIYCFEPSEPKVLIARAQATMCAVPV